jgi:hypothetical protein
MIAGAGRVMMYERQGPTHGGERFRLWTLSQEKRAGAGWMTTSSVASKKTSAKTNSQRDFALAA